MRYRYGFNILVTDTVKYRRNMYRYKSILYRTVMYRNNGIDIKKYRIGPSNPSVPSRKRQTKIPIWQ